MFSYFMVREIIHSCWKRLIIMIIFMIILSLFGPVYHKTKIVLFVLIKVIFFYFSSLSFFFC